MSISLKELVVKKYPAGKLYLPEVRVLRDPKFDPPSAPPPYTALLNDVIAMAEKDIESANRNWARGFPARARSGQRLNEERVFATRLSPLRTPEQLRGALVGVQA